MAVSHFTGDHYQGLSTDSKPSANVGSTFLETDTGARFVNVDGAGTWTDVSWIGSVSGHIDRISVEITNTTGTTAYAANDVVGTLTQMPSFARVNAGMGYITELRLATNKKSITPRFRVHFFNASNPTVAADNAQYEDVYADVGKRMGYIDLPNMTSAAGTVSTNMSRAIASGGSTGIPKPFVCAAGTSSVWVLMETLDAFTPGSAELFTIVALAEAY
jgi:hypothetical protein